MVACDLASCDKREPNGTSGFVMAHFEGRLYDFCSAAHEAKWEAELVKLGRAEKKRRKDAK